MENQAATFLIEDTFTIINRGTVLIGETTETVSNGQSLLFDNGVCWSIKSVEALYRRNQPAKIGLLMTALSSSQQAFLINLKGATARII
ncbi:hypothetical protein HHL22_17045 [Hymenobacter sp. RP-2-7]|uniref:Uncharacterized protein n=1 Tax=Hymenobacter polaris TaxID=2682546 RepID=A0A7Y0FNV5_9BACT|nr:hypothetical protein [Hymenobacter polaris]NML66915.1 hypothetical protein [Hymenobacter polaris]